MEVNLDSGDSRYEILQLNSVGMVHCHNKDLEGAQQCLHEALTRLHDADDDPLLSADEVLLERLRATTLNNMGVVESHRGEPRKSLEHLESAYALESKLGVLSPTTVINLSAIHNTLGTYDRAMALALQGVELLHKQVRESPADQAGECNVLWGAAWHNLGVAQLNCASTSDENETVTVFAIFRNAMKATQDLLGPRHPMTVAVHETFRSVRLQLKAAGVFLQHHTFSALDDRKKEISISVRQSPRSRKKYNELANSEAYDAKVPKKSRPTTQQGTGCLPPTTPRQKTASHQLRDRLRGTLGLANDLYMNPHPLLQKSGRIKTDRRLPLLPPILQQQQQRVARSSGLHSGAGGYESLALQPYPTPPQTATSTVSSRHNRTLPHGGAEGGGRGQRPNDAAALRRQQMAAERRSPRHQLSSGGGASSARHRYSQQQQQQQQYQQQQQQQGGLMVPHPPQSISDLLLGDMWVEVEVKHGGGGFRGQELDSLGMSPPPSSNSGGGRQLAPTVTNYAEATYTIQPGDPVVDPASFARAVGEHETADAVPQIEEKWQDSNVAASTSPQTQPQIPQQGSGSTHDSKTTTTAPSIEAMVNSVQEAGDIHAYPGLLMLAHATTDREVRE